MRRIAIINQKGGVGKTTTVANLGAALARAGQRVLAIDLDPQANLSLYLGVELQPTEPSAYSVLCSGMPLGEALRPTSTPGLELLPSQIDLSGAELELAATIGRETILRDSLNTWTKGQTQQGNRIDFILIDCPPSLGLLSINALCAANEVMVVAQTEFFALQGLSKLLGIIELVQARLNPDLKLTGVLASIYDARLRLAREVLGELRRFFPAETFQTTIGTNVRLAESPSHAQTIFEYAPGSRGARDYAALAEEMLAGADQPPTGTDPLADKLSDLAQADADLRRRADSFRAEDETPLPPDDVIAVPESAAADNLDPVDPPALPANPVCTVSKEKPAGPSSSAAPQKKDADPIAQTPTTLNPGAATFETAIPAAVIADPPLVPVPTNTPAARASHEAERPLVEPAPPTSLNSAPEPALNEWVVLHPEQDRNAEPEATPEQPPPGKMQAFTWGDYLGEERSRPVWPSTSSE
jgi:chromosome partitioning protein